MRSDADVVIFRFRVLIFYFINSNFSQFVVVIG